MRVITLTAPYGSLIALAARHPELGKHIETRGWRTSYRGPLAIHQAKGLRPVGGKRGLIELLSTEPFWSALREEFAVQLDDQRHYPGDAETIANELPMGAIVAVCELRDVRIIGVQLNGVPTISADDMLSLTPILGNERAFGDYSAGRYAWLLADIRALPEPIPVKGALGLWEYDGELPR